MRTYHKTQLRMLLATAVLLPFAASCSSDDDPTAPATDALVGTWQVTSFQLLGIDLIEQGMTMRITLTAAKTYTMVVTGDPLGECVVAADCTETGTYSSTSTQVTLDPGGVDDVTFNYVIQGTTMTFTGSIDGDPVTMVLQRT